MRQSLTEKFQQERERFLGPKSSTAQQTPMAVPEKGFQWFQNEVQRLSEQLEQVRADINELKRQHARALQNAVVDAEAQERREQLTAAVAANSKQIRADIAEHNVSVRQAQVQNANEVSGMEQRVLLNNFDNLKRQFSALLSEFQSDQQAYKDRITKRIRKQIEISGAHVTDEQFDEIMESGGQSVFTQQILANTQIAKQTLNDMQCRALEVQNLEKDITELNQIWVDLAVMIDQQGETVDSIEANVEIGHANVEQGAKQVQQALESTRKARKKKVFLIILGVVVLIILALVLWIVLSG